MLEKNKDTKGKLAWRCPSNIALVKYWGKHGLQLPANPSLSFSLRAACTETEASFEWRNQQEVSLDFIFEGKKNEAFAARINQYIQSLPDRVPSLQGLHLTLSSKNSFPHSSGIASSASAFGALALILNDIHYQMNEKSIHSKEFLREASEMARMGSGSASRSLYPGFAVWGKTEALDASSDQFAVQLKNNKVHDQFRHLKDAILIVSKGEKDVKSSTGHALMQGHPFAGARFKQAGENMKNMLRALETGDLESFMNIAETEAMSLHAMMMTSTPSCLLLKPESLRIMEKIRSFRKQNNIPVCFTIDAGPNIHVIYPEQVESEVKDFIQNDLLVYCEANKWIDDGMGKGPEKLK
ncbi:MAG: diphosphomevalonate decarboxylase [Bacteroidota bacterium]|nr:diphosphomevalonate decarboxylase [Bacteroidota bacterium]